MLKIKNEELIQELIGDKNDFPKYTTQILNLANQNAQGTRPRVVGQLSDLINECPEKTYKGWKKWYLSKYPGVIENAADKINVMIENFKQAINLIDEKMVLKWVEDLVLEKTFIGLKFQAAILKKIASLQNKKYRLALPDEESRGIDGFIGDVPVSIKPATYKIKKGLSEQIECKIIFYEKTKDGLNIDADAIL
ncbi:MAG: MjaI family restriction endonuclease [bacterium]